MLHAYDSLPVNRIIMSRFYDALKEASRLQAKVNETPADGEPNILVAASAPGIDVPPVMDLEVGDPPPTPEVRPSQADFLPPELLEVPAKSNGSSPKPQPDVLSQNIATEHPVRDVPKEKKLITFDPAARLITQAADAAVVEHYRRLRTKLLQQHADKPFKSLLIASPNPQEGKTVTAVNLALSFTMLADFKVLIVDGDLRRGTIGKMLGVDDQPGLSNMMDGTATLDDVVLQCRDVPLSFVLRGNSPLPAAELLHSTAALRDVFHTMTETFDLVVVDSSPVNLITDAQLLAENCDAILLVARAFSTTRKSLEQTAQELSAFRIIGTVLNGGTKAQLYRRYNGYY